MIMYGHSAITQPPYLQSRNGYSTVMATTGRTSTVTIPQRKGKSMSAIEARLSLVRALASQTSSLSLRILMDLATETSKYVFPRRFEPRNFEEALMSVPDLESVKFQVLTRKDQYEIRQVEVRIRPYGLFYLPTIIVYKGEENDYYKTLLVLLLANQPYFIAETTMPGKYGFDLNGASQSFNVLAEYLFGKNTTKENMEMTTPVFTRRTQSEGEKMEMTTPVITTRLQDHDKWQMSFVMPSKYGSRLPLPIDPSVTIKEVPSRVVAVVAFSGFVTDEEVKQRESALRNALKKDSQFQVKSAASIEVAQYNPPFTLPFTRRNEIALEVERKQE